MAENDISVAALLRDLAEATDLLREFNAKLDRRDTNLRLLADRLLILADSNVKSAEYQRALHETLLYVKQKLTELWDQREYTRAGTEEILRKLAVISKDVDDVERVTREATGQFPLIAAAAREPDRSGTVGEFIAAFRELPRGAKVFLSIAAVLLAAHGELALLLKWVFGGG